MNKSMGFLMSASTKAEQITKDVLEGRESFCGAEARWQEVLREEIAEAQREIVRMVALSAVQWVTKNVRSEPFWAKKWRGRP